MDGLSFAVPGGLPVAVVLLLVIRGRLDGLHQQVAALVRLHQHARHQEFLVNVAVQGCNAVHVGREKVVV